MNYLCMNDETSFLLEVKGRPGEPPASLGLVPVDLSEEDDRVDIKPFRDAEAGALYCTLGKCDRPGDVTREIARVWRYGGEDDTLNGKFAFYREIGVAEFVACLLEANRKFDDFTDEDIAKLKEAYGI